MNIQLSLSSGVFRSLTLFACGGLNYDGDDLVKLIEAESAAVIVGDVIAVIIINVATIIIIGQLGNIRITCANS